MPLLGVNGTQLYHEVRGEGPAVLLIMGMTGDSGHFDALAELLADEFTVVTYDRRGNRRSPRPPGWDTTSPEEQADDAAALLVALGLVPTAVYGSSAGANFALSMMLRHPEAVSRAVLHEAVLVRLFDDPEARTGVTALVREAMQAGGAPAALERLWRYVAGDENWERLEPGLRERMAASTRRSSMSSSAPTRTSCQRTRRLPRSPCPCLCSSAKTACLSTLRRPGGSQAVSASRRC